MKKEFTLIEISDERPIREWATQIMTVRYAEAVASLVEEKVEEEGVFYIEIDGKKYLAFYMKGEMLPADMERSINKEHRAVLGSVRVRRIDGELLYDVEAENKKK